MTKANYNEQFKLYIKDEHKFFYTDILDINKQKTICGLIHELCKIRPIKNMSFNTIYPTKKYNKSFLDYVKKSCEFLVTSDKYTSNIFDDIRDIIDLIAKFNSTQNTLYVFNFNKIEDYNKFVNYVDYLV